MTESQQVYNIRQLGYSEREARFLLKVALHSGYFIRRQYAPDRGQLDATLCERLLYWKHALLSKYNGKTELYHLHSKKVYRVIDEEDNRHRRPHASCYLRAKLMGLDYVINHPELHFLPTEASKLDYFCGSLGLDKSVLPVQVYTGRNRTSTPHFFVEKYPVYSNPETGKTGICYLDDGADTKGAFGAWLERHKRLIEALDSRIEVVYVSANEESSTAGAVKEFSRVLTSLPVEMRNFFEMQAAVELNGLANRDKAWLDSFRSLKAKYADTNGHYAAWRTGQQTHRETGATLKTEMLPYSYMHLPKPNKTSGGRAAAAV
jgi:hypothetical protein